MNDLVFDDPTFFRHGSHSLPQPNDADGNSEREPAPPVPPGITFTVRNGPAGKTLLQDIEPDRHRLGARSSDRQEGSANGTFSTDGHAETISAKTFKKYFDDGINPAAVPTE